MVKKKITKNNQGNDDPYIDYNNQNIISNLKSVLKNYIKINKDNNLISNMKEHHKIKFDEEKKKKESVKQTEEEIKKHKEDNKKLLDDEKKNFEEKIFSSTDS